MAGTSRWDRPPATKDVRWFLRVVGKVLICTGALMFGFVAYQLWGTGIETARAQNRLENEFEQLLERTSTTTQPTTTSTTVVPSSSSSLPVTVVSALDIVASTSSTTTTTTALPTSSTTVVAVLDYGYVTLGGPVGTIEIPSVGIDKVIVEGVGRDELKQGPGHFPGTAFPGELGNAALAGHRTTYGATFDHLPEVEIGDEIIITTATGTYTYVMVGSDVVDPSRGDVVRTTDPTRSMLTLTTCTPRGTASQRYVLYAELDPERSSPVGAYVPRQLDGTPVIPGDDVSRTTSPPASTTSAPSMTTTSTPPVSLTSEGSVAPATTTTDPTPTAAPSTTTTTLPLLPQDAGDDAFSDHWFSDLDALPQVGVWAAACTAVVVGAYQLAKHLKNSWIGLAVGVLPFIVGLYFFYQSVNRLLPATL